MVFDERDYRVTDERPESWRIPSGNERVALFAEMMQQGGAVGTEHQMNIHRLIRHIYLIERLSVDAEKKFTLAEAAMDIENKNLLDQIRRLRVEMAQLTLRVDAVENHPLARFFLCPLVRMSRRLRSSLKHAH